MSDSSARRRARFPASLDRTPSPREPLRPQAPVHHAARDARRAVTPQGLGLDSQVVRTRMVERLRAEGLACEPVLQALATVPRHEFVDTGLAIQAYEDTSLPIGHGQTISKPSVVARMLSLLFDGSQARAAGHLGRALEIGTGCGYQAALLARLARSVVSVERVRPLFERAQQQVAAHRLDTLRLVFGDGMRGHPPNAPYDSIVSAAVAEQMPEAWLAQLAMGGRLVAPVVDADGRGQVLWVIDRDARGWHRTVLDAVRFVPLKSGTV